ncbi:MAG: EVE domain-containing protein [Chloroflexota bacterium]|jgi:hypothetical protein
MRYWLDLFTWTTWREHKDAGAKVSGFRERRWRTVQRMKPGDLLLCYMTGLSRFFAILEVTGEPYRDSATLWSEATFSARVPVKVVLELTPEYAVPVKMLSDRLSYFQNMRSPHSWTGHFRGSPTGVNLRDAQVIIEALREAERNPVYREFDPRKLERRVPVYETEQGVVTIPEDEENETSQIEAYYSGEDAVTHEEIQWLLLNLGSQMGLDVWVARNDRGKSYQGMSFEAIPRLRQFLPTQFDDATNKTIELIDVLWLRGNAIVAAFEIEHSTSVYSGLLRLSDLISMQPNLNIRLYIVAPDDREDKVFREVNRPTFTRSLKPPLTEICQFIPYSALRAKLEKIKDVLPYVRPDFLDTISESLEAS